LKLRAWTASIVLTRSPINVKRAWGALGFCCSMTTTRADARTAVQAVRDLPTGDRFSGPSTGASMRRSILNHLARADEEVFAIGAVEHIAAIKSVGDIAFTPGLD
jgi:2-keto-3-deoxy-L-rhamnonate aldolase RhmA